MMATATMADEPPPGQTIFQNLCVQCHAAKGEGNVLIKAPAIAGMPDWYVLAQMKNFQTDKRGAHPLDTEGQLMRAMSKMLNVDQTRAVADYVSKLPRNPLQSTITADITEGKRLYAERCMECHRYNGEGDMAYPSPPVMGLQDWYLVSRMKKYQNGIQGAEKDDKNGQKMVFSSTFIEDEATLQSLVAYLMQLPEELKKTKANAFGSD
jgi:cytochrome c553